MLSKLLLEVGVLYLYLILFVFVFVLLKIASLWVLGFDHCCSDDLLDFAGMWYLILLLSSWILLLFCHLFFHLFSVLLFS